MRKPLLHLMVLCTVFGISATELHAQIPRSEHVLIGIDDMWYASLDCIKNAKITRVRETYYKADSITRKVDMKKPYKISLYALSYLGDVPYGVQQVAAFASDTNTLVENYQWAYDAAGRLMGYQGVSNDGFEYGNSVQIQRDGEGLITFSSSALTFSLKTPAKPVTYSYKCYSNGKNLISARQTIQADGKEILKRFSFTYDANSNLISALLEDEKNKLREYSYTYNAANKLTERKELYHSQYDEYVPGTTGSSSIFGVFLEGTAATTKTVKTVSTYLNTYEYDKQNRLIKMNYSYTSSSSNSGYYEEYSYSPSGMLETISMYDEKGLTGIKKLICN
jgi:hypothetical protein